MPPRRRRFLSSSLSSESSPLRDKLPTRPSLLRSSVKKSTRHNKLLSVFSRRHVCSLMFKYTLLTCILYTIGLREEERREQSPRIFIIGDPRGRQREEGLIYLLLLVRFSFPLVHHLIRSSSHRSLFFASPLALPSSLDYKSIHCISNAILFSAHYPCATALRIHIINTSPLSSILLRTSLLAVLCYTYSNVSRLIGT